MPDFVCPKCGSDRLRRSHTRGVSEKLTKVLGWRAYRCREKSCGWRGLIKTNSFREEIRNRPKQVFTLILVVVVLIISIFLVIYLRKYQPLPALQ